MEDLFPMSSGYSEKPLAQKLGIRPGQTLAFLNAPDDYDAVLGELPNGAIVARDLKEKLDLIQLFVRDASILEREFRRLKRKIKQDGMIWVSWPKGSSKLQTDLSENTVRGIGLKNGLVDVKICAIDESWSALKFLIRVKDRQ